MSLISVAPASRRLSMPRPKTLDEPGSAWTAHFDFAQAGSDPSLHEPAKSKNGRTDLLPFPVEPVDLFTAVDRFLEFGSG